MPAIQIKAKAKTVIPKGEPIVLVGHSAGGMIALAAQHDHPELFKATILSAPLLGIDNPIVKNKEEFFAKLDLPEIIKQSYVPGGGGWKPRSHISSALKEADFSSDPIRNKIQDHHQAELGIREEFHDPEAGFGRRDIEHDDNDAEEGYEEEEENTEE